MPAESILDAISMSALDTTDKMAVHGLFANYRKNKPAPLNLPVRALFDKRQALLSSLTYYDTRVEQLNPASFKYLNIRQRIALTNELVFAFYIFSAQYQLDKIENRRQALKNRSRQIQHCAYLIEELKMGSAKTPEQILAQAARDAGKHAKYLGLTVVAPFVADKIVEFISNKATTAPVKPIRTKEWDAAGQTGVIRDWMNEVNGLRLYWVWGGGLLNTVLGMLSEDFGNVTQAQQGVVAPAPITGYMSWILYYARFGINLSLLLKHTIAGPWMSAEEKSIPAWERFKTQWDQRKFALLNDSIWATANMVCFFWLTGAGMLGYYGNVATALLLIMDVALTAWKFYEESTQHNINMQRYKRDIDALEAKKSAEQNNAVIELLTIQVNNLKTAQRQCALDWQYKKYGLTNDLVYAVGLLIAFSVMCCFLFPPAAMAPAVAAILGVAGAALCFVLTAANAAIRGGLEIAKLHQTRQLARKDCESLLADFIAATDENLKKKLYLDMKQLVADSDYQQRLINFQKIKLLRSILIDVMVPPLIFVSLVFMPLGIGLAVLAAGLALALITGLLLKQKRFEPEAPSLPEMDEAEYEAFAANPTMEHLEGKKIMPQIHKPKFVGCVDSSSHRTSSPVSDSDPRSSDPGTDLVALPSRSS